MESTTVAILGAGMSGICMAIKLREAGITDIVLLEKSEGPGGTWHDNTYPGACCDVASHLYSFSFEPNPGWSRAFSPQDEIEAYFAHCVDKYGLASSIRYNTAVTAADWRESSSDWELTTSGGDKLLCRFLVSGLGQLNLPNIPRFEGLEDFHGESFHSARWDHNVDLRGKRVAVIGNAASAIQFIPPVAEQADHVYVYQRSANYIVPRNDRVFSEREKQLYGRFPVLLKLSRLRWYLRQELLMFGGMMPGSLRHRLMTWMARKYLEAEITDPEQREKLTPDYPLGCKRVLVSDDYYQALAGESVDIVTAPIRKIGQHGVETEDGVDRPVDVLIFGTGFRATEFLAPVKITGVGGRTLDAAWSDGAWALHGVAVPDFPNLFMLYGPNTNLGHNSIIYMVEGQVSYIRQCIDKMLAHDIRSLQANSEVTDRYNVQLQEDLGNMVWGADCGSWYKNEQGKITNNWPHSTLRYRFSIRSPDFTEYDMSA
jgi:cation diffusion facilitator CzcD-associated flavoprotein CzcO